MNKKSFISESTLAVKIHNVTKEYIIHHDKPTLVESLLHRKSEKFKAIDNLNLKINKGEKIGIIGPNGSGKTTLLKLIAGISTPTSGSIKTQGKIVSLIDLEAGFHPDLTGEQNIFLNGLLLGMTKKEIQSKFKEIVQYANIGKFIDVPLFTYSEGMKLRISFSIAIHADPEILILDENMSVGDSDFQKKSQKTIRSLFLGGATIILVSQWLEFIKSNCNRIIEFKQGKIVSDKNI